MTSTRKQLLYLYGGMPEKREIHKHFQSKEWLVQVMEPPASAKLSTKQGAKPAYIGTIRDLSPVPGNSMDGIWFSNKLQYVALNAIPELMHRLTRILRPNGLLITVMPDAMLAAEHIFEYRITEPLVIEGKNYTAQDILYGPEGAFSNCFTAGSLGKIFLHSGFRNIQVSRQSGNLWVAATHQPKELTANSEKVRIIDHNITFAGPPDSLSAPPKKWTKLNLQPQPA